MAAENIPSLFTWTDQAGNEHTLDVDVVSSGVDERTAQLTDHVVETGAVITDHVIIQPESLTLELVVSQTPLRGTGFAPGSVPVATQQQSRESVNIPLQVRPSQFVPGGFLLLSSGLRTAISSLIASNLAAPSLQGSKFSVTTGPSLKATVLQASETRDRVADVHDELIRILDGALPVTVAFKGRVYVDYLLTRVTLTSNPGEFGLGRFGVDLRAYRTVTGTTVQLPDPADFRALPKKSVGNKNAKKPSPDAEVKLKSLAARGFDTFQSGKSEQGEESQ